MISEKSPDDTPLKKSGQQVSIGQSVKRIEDARLVTGQGSFTDDVDLQDCLFVRFLRSPYAKAKILSIDTDDAREVPGVIGVYTGEDTLSVQGIDVNPIIKNARQTHYPILANDQIMAVGQPVAAVVATTASAALDALELIFLDVEEQDMLDKDGSPQALFPEYPDNIVFSEQWTTNAGSLKKETHSVSVEIQHPRVAPSALEPRAMAVQWSFVDESMTLWLSSQTPHRARTDIAKILSQPLEKIHVISKDVGGAFGMKASLYPEEIFTAWAAKELQRSVRWTSTRGEDLQAASHGRGIKTQGTLEFTPDGTFKSLTASATAPLGHWLTYSASVPAWNAIRILPGPYEIEHLDLTTKGEVSNTAPVGIYRGAGRPEAAMLMERLVDEAAHQLKMDPIDLRLKNLIPAHNLPHTSVSGRTLDTGDYPAALKRLAENTEYTTLREQQNARRVQGILNGIGLAFYVEPSGIGWESASIQLLEDGTILAATGTSSQGHGRETAFSQIVADCLGVPLQQVTIKHSDSRHCPEGVGALASRSTGIGGSAMLGCAKKLRDQIFQITAIHLKCTTESLHMDAGGIIATTDNHKTASFQEIARNAADKSLLKADYIFRSNGEAWGYGCYLASVLITPETGELTVEKLSCVDDAGVLINPMLVQGQIMGGIAQGIGEATLEQIIYDDTGQLITGSMMDYGLPRADNIPPIEISSIQTPSSCNPLGAKGVGEAGTIGAPAAIMNAALDALRPHGVTELDMPLTSEKIWRALNGC